MEKFWLKQYPPTVPSTVDVAEYASLTALLEAACKTFSDNSAYQHEGVSLTYQQLFQFSTQFAAYLQSKGFQKGDRLALMMPNLLSYPIALFGALRLGLVVVNVNPLYTAHELTQLLKDAKPTGIVVFSHFAQTVQSALAEVGDLLVITTRYTDFFSGIKKILARFVIKYIKRLEPSVALPTFTTFTQALAAGKALSLTTVPCQVTDTAFLQYTGGTTGTPKAAILTHGNLLANVAQLHAWFAPYTKTGAEKLIAALPIYHVFSLTVHCFLFLKFGASSVLVSNPKDLNGLIRHMQHSHFTGMIGVNVLFNALANHPKFSTVDFSALHLCIAGGAALQAPVAQAWQKITGTPILQGYGLTETSPVVSVELLDTNHFTGSIGLPLPSTSVKLLNAHGQLCVADEPGELCVKGPQVMQGYWQQPEETQSVFTDDGYFKTGDIATMDDKGFLSIVDRKKEMINVSGFNVFPAEVEAAIATLTAVAEVGVIGVADQQQGEAVIAFVVKTEDALTEATVRAHCRGQLTGYKVPKRVIFMDTLPKTAVGKISRKLLAEQYRT